jgi:hypothetical protein
MNFYFDNYSDFSAQHASPSGRRPDPTNYPYSFNPHEPCSYCSDSYHSASSCPSWGQFCNISYEQMNPNFSSPGFNANPNFYNPDWSNHPDFSCEAQAMGNCAPQFQELHHPDYPQFDSQSSHPSSYNYPASFSQSTLEDTLKVFIELTGQAISNMKNATMENTQVIARIEGQIEYLVDEVTIIEEEEFQSQLMATTYYMIDEDDFSISYHEHAQATATLGSEVVFEEIANGPSLKDPSEESDAQIEFNLDLVPEQEEALLDSTPEIRPGNGETIEISFPSTSFSAAEFKEKGEHLESVEHLEHSAPPSNPKSSNDKEMSIEAHSFIKIPLETFHELQASILKCLKEPSYAETVKDLCTQPRKSRNHRPKKILRSKQVGYIRWRNILLEGYQIFKRKGWKGLVGHPHDRGRRCKFSFPFLLSVHLISFIFHFISCYFIFVSDSN